jgi:hypothetical protein
VGRRDFYKLGFILKKALTYPRFLVIIYESSGTTRYDSVAQLDRVTDYESVGLGFESLPGHQTFATRTPRISRHHFGDGIF